MIPWELLETARVPGSKGELTLHRRGHEYSIRVNGRDLMNSHLHGSEEALSRIACGRIVDRPRSRVLIGGLGMGFTLAAALRHLGSESEVVVAELAPVVIEWNRGCLAELAGRPLFDPRVTVIEGDVAEILRSDQQAWDAILLDVDNGPEGFTRKHNDWLYARSGLTAASGALRPKGVLGVWSACSDRGFPYRLRTAGYLVDEFVVPAGPRGGGHHTIWIAQLR
jgi:spermidine synthase